VISVISTVLVWLSGCGSRAQLLGTIQAQTDGAFPATDATDATDAAASSRPQFSAPQIVAAVSDPMAWDSDPTFTGDLRELYFMSDRSGSPDIWVSRRASASDPWGSPTIVSVLNSPASESGPAVSLDGLNIWFATEREAGSRHIWKSSRASTLDAWAPPMVVSELASTAKDSGPAVDALETTMFFGSNRAGSTALHIYFTTRANTYAPWGAVKQVPGVNSNAFEDWDPFLAAGAGAGAEGGGLVILFASTRQGAGDIFWSQRQSTAEPFPTPVPMVELNSAAPDTDPNLSPDMTYIMFDSQRAGNFDIYEAHLIR